MKFHEAVAEFAHSQIGQQEITGNQGFKDTQFLKLMESVGWKLGQAWCVYFAEACWTTPSYSKKAKYVYKMEKLFHGSAVQTYRNFKEDSHFEILDKPRVGSIAIWQRHVFGKPDWRGHAGVVWTSLADNKFTCIEGNTNSNGGREGIEVAIRKRKINFKANPESKSQLVLKGFIYIRDYDSEYI